MHTNTDNLDSKHNKIVNKAKEISLKNLLKSYRNWSAQDDCGIPFQLNFHNIKFYGFKKYIRYLLALIKTNILYGRNLRSHFFDDISLIKLINGYDILEKCPVHESPGDSLAFFLNKKVSANNRWLRYIYFVSVIRDYFKKKEKYPNIILDIGSFYGGFQYVAKKTFPNSKHILVDFPHQLCRSAIFLGYSFPESQIFSIHDQETLEEYFSDKKYRDIDFLLLSIDFYNNFSERYSDSNFIKVDLLTNFYSFGEMPKKFFSNYLNSNIMRNSQNLYFCNRYDSSPFYEPTYQESYSILDYLIDGFKIELNRSSGIHSYMNPVRKVNNIIRARPISSGYFDLIQSKKV